MRRLALEPVPCPIWALLPQVNHLISLSPWGKQILSAGPSTFALGPCPSSPPKTPVLPFPFFLLRQQSSPHPLHTREQSHHYPATWLFSSILKKVETSLFPQTVVAPPPILLSFTAKLHKEQSRTSLRLFSPELQTHTSTCFLVALGEGTDSPPAHLSWSLPLHMIGSSVQPQAQAQTPGVILDSSSRDSSSSCTLSLLPWIIPIASCVPAVTPVPSPYCS